MSTERKPSPAVHPSVDAARSILAEVQDPRIGDLLRYWLQIHPGDRLPSRRDFDPLEVPRALPHIVLVDVEREPLRFRVRLAGTAVVRALELDPTGRYLDDAFPDFTNSLAFLHRKEVVESGLPRYRSGKSTLAFRLDFSGLERIHLPLATDGRTVDMVLTAIVYAAHDEH